MRPCWCSPKRQHDWVWREPPLFDEKKAVENVIPLAFYHLNLEEWLPFNSRGWSTSRTALLQKTETCCTTTSYSKILFSFSAHIHNTDMVESGPLDVPPCTPQKRRWVTSTLKKSTKASNSYKVQDVKHFRTKRQISKSENTQDLQSDDKSAVKVCCPSNVSLMLCNSSLTPIHLPYTCTVAATEYLVSNLKWKKTLLAPRYLFFA